LGNQPYNPDDLDYDDGVDYADDQAITAAGYDSRSTPVDTLMAGPVSMHLNHALNMDHGDYSPEYANL
jgi:hypothetical protein